MRRRERFPRCEIYTGGGVEKGSDRDYGNDIQG